MFEQLLEQVRRKDRIAQKKFYHQFSVMMFRLVYRYVNNEADAGSIVNMGFFKIFEHFQDFVYHNDERMIAWMKKIMVNESLQFIRKKISILNLDEIDQEYLQKERFSEDHLELEDYYLLIGKLPCDLRAVFNLYAIDGYSHKEIADQLNISESSSRVYLSRARKMLQESLLKIINHGRE